MREKLTYLFVHQTLDNPTDPTDPRVETQFLDYDANGNITHIERATNNPEQPMDESRESVRKFVWDEEDRLMGVDLRPESPRNQPHIAAYTYDAGGERGIQYVPRQMGGVYSATQAGYAQDMDIMLYPNALITVRPQELPEDFDPKRMHPEHIFTTYTKHYYIGSERINSKLGTVNNLGVLCEETGSYDLISEMNTRTVNAGNQLKNLYNYLDKDLDIDAPYLYSTSHSLVCGFKSHNPKMYDAYWYHPDHLGSSSFITNTTGEISQHLEYLPFGETLIEEHLNSHNSPFKFNAKEYDAETGNYYYGARYYDPKWSMWLSVDPLVEAMPSWSPYNYTFNNPLKYTDPTGMVPEKEYPDSYKGELGKGDWRESDRINNNSVWQEANKYNIQNNNTGQYEPYEQVLDLYKWVQNESTELGQEVKWMEGAIGLVQDLHKYRENYLEKALTSDMITALEELNSSIADATLSYFNDLLYSGNNYVGNAAYIWDLCLVTYEQGTVATPIYNNMSQATLNKFNDLVRGKNSSTVGWNKFIGRFNNVNFGNYGKNVWDTQARIDIPMNMLYGDKHKVR